jgi:conjugative transfer pilus assembly protein TraH
MKTAIRILVASCAFSTGLFTSQSALADAQTVLNDVFNMYTNMTDPQVLESQQRDGISFGSISIRNRIVRPQLVNYEPHQWRGGCTGLDITGGGFSFINSDQLIQALRAVASNAATYAFSLALEGVCPGCNSSLKWLKDKADAINKLAMDSCSAAQALVDSTGLKQWHDKQVVEYNSRESAAGIIPDPIAGLIDRLTSYQRDENSGQFQPENVVWKAMQRTAYASWYGPSGDVDLLEAVMSVTGTVLKTPTNSSGNECFASGGARDYCIGERPSIMKVQDFLDGTRGGTTPINIYRCGGGATATIDCLDVTSVSTTSFVGIRDRVHEMLFGPPPGVSGGLVYKMRDPTAQLTDRERRFLESVPMPLWRMLKDSAYEPGTLIAMARAAEEQIANSMTKELLLEMIGTVTVAYEMADTEGHLQFDNIFRERLKEREKEIREFKWGERSDVQNMVALLDLVRVSSKAAGDKTPVVNPSVSEKTTKR